jgi:hypothetical protein
MTSQTTGAAPGSSQVWPGHAAAASAYDDCTPLFSLAAGAADVRVRRTTAGGRDGSHPALGGPCDPTTAAVAPDPESPRNLPGSSPRSTDLRPDLVRLSLASAGTRRGVPASATQITAPAQEAGGKEENR